MSMNHIELAPASNSAPVPTTKKRTGKKMAKVSANAEALKAEQAKADETNKARTGKGLRVSVGQTRGKNPSVINWEAFDKSLPETLPVSQAEFMELTKVTDEPTIVGYLIDGFNDAAYTSASDEIAEFVEDYWDDATILQFRTAVRNYARSADSTIEEAAALLKPGTEKGYQKRLAAAKQPAA